MLMFWFRLQGKNQHEEINRTVPFILSAEELEKKVKNAEIPEHLAWEDLILVENLEASIAAIDGDIKAIQKPS